MQAESTRHSAGIYCCWHLKFPFWQESGKIIHMHIYGSKKLIWIKGCILSQNSLEICQVK